MGGSTPTPDTYAQNKQAAVSREMYNYWKQNFQPVEGQLINEMNDPTLVTGTVAKAKTMMGQSLDASNAAQMRSQGRYGITMTPERVKALTRANNLNRGLSSVSAANTSRQAVDQYKTKVLNGIGALGRRTSGDAMNGFSDVASMANQRNRANRSIAASNNAANTQAGATVAAAAIAAVA